MAAITYLTDDRVRPRRRRADLRNGLRAARDPPASYSCRPGGAGPRPGFSTPSHPTCRGKRPDVPRRAVEPHRGGDARGRVALLPRDGNATASSLSGGGSRSISPRASRSLRTQTRARWPAFALIEGGLASITPAVAPVIAVPTTAGTGSEVGARRADHARRRGASSASSGPTSHSQKRRSVRSDADARHAVGR